MKSKTKIIGFFLLLVICPYSKAQICDDPKFSRSIGFNYLFYNESSRSKLEGIGDKWRQFLAWHNLGYGPEEFDITSDSPNEFQPSWRYSPGNYTSDASINRTLQNLKSNGKIELTYSSFSASHTFLTTDMYFSNGSWEESLDPDLSQVSWRKPIPFYKDLSGTSLSAELADGESFTDYHSYRFFAEFMSYYIGYFGNPDEINGNIADLSLYESNGYISDYWGWNDYISLWNEPSAHWTQPNDFGYFKPLELAHFAHAAMVDYLI